MYDAKWDLRGFDAVFKKMRGLSPALKGKAGRSALGSAAAVVTRAAKANAKTLDDPATAENISKNIAQRFSTKYQKQTGDLKFRVGVLGGAAQYANTRANVRKGRAGAEYVTGGSSGNPGGDTFYWRFLEFGTQHMRAQPFLRPALENNIGNVQTVFADKLEKQLDKLVK
jgi:HK97 gp10 family phage protein